MIQAILIVAVIVLAYIVVRSKQQAAEPKEEQKAYVIKVQQQVDEKPMPPPEQKSTPPAEGFAKRGGYEAAVQRKLKENNEYFATGCSAPFNADQGPSCSADNQFAKYEYGAPNMDYKEFVASQAVDEKVIANHLEFVRERRGLGPEGEFTTGRTYSPDSHDSYDPVPWVGIRGRPRAVPQCNPTQVPDMDTSLFKGPNPYRFFA